MAAKITVKPKIEISCITCKFVGYMMFRNQIPFIQRLHISNPGLIELQDLELSFRSEPEFIIPIKKEVKVLPLKQTVAVDCVDVCLSPLFLGNLSSVCEGKLFIQVSQNGKVLGEGSYTTKILPFDYMGNIDSYTELLASFVKPRAAGINQLLLEAQAILKSWKMPTEMSGYEGAEKNHIRQIAAAIYTAIQKRQIKKIPALHDYDGENRILSAAEILDKKEATYLDISLLYASCLEAAGINPIIVIGKDKVNVCFWLYENCMNESVSDDLSMLIKRTSDGINEIAGADIASLFVGAKLNFAGAEKEAYANFNQPSWFDYIIDIRRCRFGAIRALPERIATAHGYDMVAEEDTEIGAKPAEIKGTRRLDTKFAASRERQWERRLLDLSLRNTLLNFKVNSNVVHVLSTNLSETVNRVDEGGEFLLLEEPKDSTGTLSGINTFGSQITASTLQELVSLELKNKRLHCLTDQKSMISSLSGLYRRERTCLEETGAGTLYLAAGFLKWHERNDRYNEKYAPLVLLPVALVKKESGKGFSLKIREEEVQLNTTLLEFLMQEFGVDIRGLAEFKKEEFSLPDIIATVRSAILNLKNWDVVQDVYIASFSFTRFLMWNDVHYHIEEFKKNKLVSSLIHNKSDFSNKDLTISDVNVDEDYTPQEILTPISADSSQFAAIAAMHEGKSFVLHGPPGTGKSQTITNIIADALYQGKRVLFVAEKMAALSVVKKRLDEIGIGDFCLELHSNKVNKVEVAERILRTLSLSGVNASEFNRTANQIAQMRKDLNEEIQALHRVRRLNISVYDAIVRYNQNKFAPDCIDIESTFFDQLDADSLDRYENLLLEISAAAIESGGVYNSPFSNLELFEYNADLQNNLIISGKILTEEIRHFKNYTEMVFDILGSHVRTLTQKKLESLVALCEMMTSQSAEFDIFKAEDNRQVLISIKTYLNLLKDYDSALQKYNEQYKILVEL
ncbi:MAG: DUF4011 domain-containing protein, partial [Clostridia bacterium]|nr:DUF4011 domain-containing protein [Clostridia bacterium]